MTAVTANYREGGFTLLEVLVVVAIIGIVAGAALLTFGDGGLRELRSEGRRLSQVLEWAADEAVFRQTQLGVFVDGDGYRIVEWSPAKQAWLPPRDGEQALAARHWRGRFQHDLQVDGEGVLDDETVGWPDLLFMASGDFVPFQLRLTIADRARPAVTIAGRADGGFSWTEEREP